MTPLRLLLSALFLLAAPAALAQTDLIVDGSFESQSAWDVITSTGTSPYCDVSCGPTPRTGASYVFLAGFGVDNDMSVSQTITIPAEATSALLTYHLQLGGLGDATGEFGLYIDTIQLETFDQDDIASFPDYVARNVDLSAFADGQPHTIRFVGVEVAGTTTDAYFGALVDDVSLVVDTPPPPPSGGLINDFLFAAAPIAVPDTFLTATNVGADAEEETYNPPASCVGGGLDGNNAVWWTFAATGVGTMQAFVQGGGSDPVDTILTVLTLNSDGSLVEVGCNDDRTSDPADGSEVVFETMADTRYFVRVTGYQGAAGELSVGVGGVSAALSTFVTGPANDHIAMAPGPLLFSRAPALYPDSNVGATEESGEPLASCVSETQDGRNSVWRSLGSPADGTVTVDWSGSGFDTIATVYEVSSAGGLTEVACDDDGGDGTTSLVTFPVTAGTGYVIRTVGFEGASGAILQSLTFDPVTASEAEGPVSALALAAWPNPTAGAVRLGATVPEAGVVRVDVFDALGRTVATIHDGPVVGGTAAWTWDASAQPAGVYVVRLTANGAVRTQTVTVVR